MIIVDRIMRFVGFLTIPVNQKGKCTLFYISWLAMLHGPYRIGWSSRVDMTWVRVWDPCQRLDLTMDLADFSVQTQFTTIIAVTQSPYLGQRREPKKERKRE